MLKPVKILQASAGSGKTFSLAVHYLTLLFSNENKYREILAVTFTNKATEEMKTRILDVLRGLALQDDSSSIDSYKQLILKAYPDFTKEILSERADIIYRKILHDYSRFSVSTIDGFVQKVIRGFAFELGLDAAYSLEMNIDKVKDNLVDRLDKELDKNPELVKWIISLAKERIDENKSWNYKTELLSLTGEIFKERFADFDNALNTIGLENANQVFYKYAAQTKEEIQQFENSVSALAQSALGIMERLNVVSDELKGKSRSPLLRLKKLAEKDFKEAEKLFVLIDASPDEWFQKNASQDCYPEINTLLKQIQVLFEAEGANYVLAQQFNKNVYYLRLMQELAVLLKDYREESGNLLISDAQNLLSGITKDAGDNPSFIWEKIGNKYKNFLFDEFQDTSVSQWGSFNSLVKNAVASPSGTLTDHLIVGDTKQSIYRWRNGDWNILHSQAKIDLALHNVNDDYLEENYRSSTNIIRFNNFLYKRLPQLIQTKLNGDVLDAENNQLSQWWNEKNYHEIINNIYAQAEQKVTPYTPEGGTIKVKKFVKEEEDERLYSDSVFREYSLNYLISEIQDLKENRQYHYKDMSVLVRSNREALETVQALMEAQIPVVSGEALLIANNTAIKLILNTLNVLVGFKENTSLYKANCIALYHKIKNEDINPNSYLNLRFKSLEELSHLLPEDLCKNAQSWMQLPLPELAEKIIKSYGLDSQQVHLPYLLAFRDITGNASRQGEKGILSFLSWWEEDGYKKALPSPEEANAVQILTIHKSKGLAFRAVFIPFCDLSLSGKTNSIFWVPSAETPYHELGSIPLKYTKSLAKSSVAKYYFEEELYRHMDSLNMIYVATTRAKDYIYMGIKAKTKEEEMNTIGDLLNSLYKDEFDEEHLFKEEAYLAKPEQEHQRNTIVLEKYPTSDRVSEIYKPLEEKNINHILNLEKAGRDGSILHDILAAVKNINEVDDYLKNLNLQGTITADEMENFRKEAVEVLSHPDLQQLLASADKTIEEKGIIDRHGKQHRPDKVILSKGEIIIIDYKFTLKEYQEHELQVQNYKDLFYAMGYKKVSAYLFYAITKKIKAI